MEIIDQFCSSISKDFMEVQRDVWEKTQHFLDKMSLVYTIDQTFASDTKGVKKEVPAEIDVATITDSRESTESDNGEKHSEVKTQELEFDSMVTIAGYLDQRHRDIESLISFVENSEFYGKSYQKNLNNLSEEILELKDKFVKDFKKKDREDLIDGFVSKFLKLIRTNLFETVYDNIYRYSLTAGNDSSIIEFKKLIDEFMEKSGFSKYEMELGEVFNSKVCSSENPEYTDNPDLHKTIKDIIWYPYILTYFSYAESRQVKKIIRGKVICYSSKI